MTILDSNEIVRTASGNPIFRTDGRGRGLRCGFTGNDGRSSRPSDIASNPVIDGSIESILLGMIQTFKCADTQTLFERQSVKWFKALNASHCESWCSCMPPQHWIFCACRPAITWKPLRVIGLASTASALTINGGCVLSAAMARRMTSKSWIIIRSKLWQSESIQFIRAKC